MTDDWYALMKFKLKEQVVLWTQVVAAGLFLYFIAGAIAQTDPFGIPPVWGTIITLGIVVGLAFVQEDDPESDS